MFSPFRNEIKAFLALAEFKSVSKAALSLGMTQPQLSKILSRLESDLGTILFERTNRGLISTDKGFKLYEDLSKLQKFWSELSPDSRILPSMFRIGSHPLIAKEFFPRIVQELEKSCPTVTLQYIEASSKEVSHLILDRKIELGLAANPMPLQGLIIQEIEKQFIGLYRTGKIHEVLVINPQLVMYSRIVKKLKYKKIMEIENYELAARTAEKIGCDVLLPNPVGESHRFKELRVLQKVSICLVYREELKVNVVVKSIRELLYS